MTARASGFSLLETIVAMTIVGIAFAVLFGGMSTATRGAGRIETFDQDLETSRSLVAAIDLLGAVRPGDAARGTTPSGREWRVETEAFIPATPESPLAVLRLRLVLEAEGGGEDGWTIDSYKTVDTRGMPVPLEDQLDAILD